MKLAVYNPHNKPEEELPAIYGWNNGGEPGWYHACLIADSGHGMGSHLCSHEGFIPGDLGLVEDSRPDRHEGFRQHYPDGYRMVYVQPSEVMTHPGLNAAVERNRLVAYEAKAAGAD